MGRIKEGVHGEAPLAYSGNILTSAEKIGLGRLNSRIVRWSCSRPSVGVKFVDLSLKSLNGLDERGDGIFLVHAPQKFEKVPKPIVTKAVPSLGVLSLDLELHLSS